jgi:hypothetical protein
MKGSKTGVWMSRSSLGGLAFRPALALAVLTLLASPKPANADISTIVSEDSAVWGAFGADLFKYKEPSSPPDLPDSEHGWIPSGAAGASYFFSDQLYLSVDGSVTFGNAPYSGALFYSPTTYASGSTDETIYMVDGKIGRGFALGQQVMLIPYVEIGYRYWDRNLGAGQVEDYQNYDTLGGLMVQFAPVNSLILTLYGSAGTTFGATAKASPDTYNLGNSAMYKVGGKIGYDLTQQLEVFTTLDYDHFRYGQSSLASDFSYEPSSSTEDTALRVGMAYHFK